MNKIGSRQRIEKGSKHRLLDFVVTLLNTNLQVTDIMKRWKDRTGQRLRTAKGILLVVWIQATIVMPAMGQDTLNFSDLPKDSPGSLSQVGKFPGNQTLVLRVA